MAVEVDRLFREVETYCRQQDRDNVHHGLSRKILEMQLAMKEEQLHAYRTRSEELSQSARQLDDALMGRRARYAACLRPHFVSGAGLREPERDVVLEELAPDPASGSTSWRDIQARIPSSRKHSVRESLHDALKAAGIHNLLGNDELDPYLSKSKDTAIQKGIESTHDDMAPHASASSRMEFADASEDDSPNASDSAAPWSCKLTLRSHLDAVRTVMCQDDVLISGGEDAVVKMWDLSFLRHGGDHEAPDWDDIEPYASFRGHSAAVLALARKPDQNWWFSGSADSDIRVWRCLAASDYRPYDPTPPGHCDVASVRRLQEHQDAVWALSLHPAASVLASASADRTIRLWHTEFDSDIDGASSSCSSLKQLALEQGSGVIDVPTCVCWSPQVGTQLHGGFASSTCALFDVERGVVVHRTEVTPERQTSLDASVENASCFSSAAVTSIACHSSEELVITGHVDRCARVFCPSSGQSVQKLEGHNSAVAAVALDPRGGFQVATGSHDGYLRLFDLRTGSCFQEMALHERKYDEALHCICNASDRIVTGGADACIAVLGLG